MRSFKSFHCLPGALGKCKETLSKAFSLHSIATTMMPLFILISATSVHAQISACTHFLIGDSVPKNLKLNTFTTNRGLNDYADAFKDLKSTLKKLNGNQHWIDLGSGDGKAIYDFYFSFEGRAKTTGVVLVEPEFSVRKHLPQQSYSHFSGRFFEDIPLEEFEKADVITDYYGVLSYTKDFSGALAKILALLKPNGTLYIFNGYNVGHHKLTQIRTSSGLYGIADFLKQVEGLKVSTFKEPIKNSSWGLQFGIKIIRQKNYVEGNLPPLRLLKFEDSNPPVRIFGL